MSGPAFWSVVLAVAVLVHGLLAGASLDQSIEQLPARHRIGVRAYLAYTRASHMANGRFWLIPLGILGPLLSAGAAVWAVTLDLPRYRALPVFLGGVLAVLNLLSTVKAAGINLTLAPWRPGADDVAKDETALAETFRRFERWQAVRASVQFLNFAVAILAVAVSARLP